MPTLEFLQSQIDEIKKRNARVGADKAWETSLTRKFTILVLTYIFARLPEPFVNAFVLSPKTHPLFPSPS